MNATNAKGFLIGVIVTASSLSVLAAVSLPNSFTAGTPIKASEVNANFTALRDFANSLETSKLSAVAHDASLAGDGNGTPLELASGAVSANKIAAVAPSAGGQVLTWNGAQLSWGGRAIFESGVSSPTGTLAAIQAENAGAEAAWLRTTSASSTFPVIKLHKHPNANSNFLECVAWDGTNAATPKCHIDKNGTFVAGSDFAEAMPSEDQLEPGDVVVLRTDHPGAIARSGRPYDMGVAGVYSTRPGVLGAEKGDLEAGATRVNPDDVPVAIVGIVPTKVTTENGPIHPGDLLTTSSAPGRAMRATPITVDGVPIYPSGTIIGKALGSLERGRGVIRVLLTLR